MSSISKQALLVENNTNFPDNNTGYITPSKLREFNVDLIDSTVNQATYSVDIAGIQSDIAALEAFTASQQPSFAALNSFTQSQIVTNNALNAFTQSAGAELDSLSAWTGSWNAWTSSINEIRDDGILQGYSTRFFFNGLVSASIVQNVGGPIANVTVESDPSKLNVSTFNAYTSSQLAVSASVAAVSASFNAFSTSLDTNFVSEVEFTAYSSSVNNQFNTLSAVTGAFATTGSNTFVGVQTIVTGSGKIQFQTTGGGDIELKSHLGLPRLIFNNVDTNEKIIELEQTTNNVIIDYGVEIPATFRAIDVKRNGGLVISSSVALSDVLTVVGNQTNNNSRVGITGQSSDGPVWLLGNSGSLVLSNNASTPTYASLSHISSSQANANTNIIFKTNSGTISTIVSGSNNIFVNQISVTAGFNRYVGGSGNIYTNVLPQLTGSAAFPVTMANNISNAGVIFRAPVSSSTYTVSSNLLMNSAGTALNFGPAGPSNFERAVSGLNVQNNIIAGNINAVAFKTPLSASINISSNMIGGAANLNMDSSSINLAGTTIQGNLTINNSYLPSTVNANSSLAVNGSLTIGAHTIFASGSNATFTAGRTVSNIAMIGAANVISASLNGDNSNVNATILLGQGLVALGSNTRQAGPTMPDYGTVYVGRWNSIAGNDDLTGPTVFAVGTGTGEATRRTGFLIDSGSNSIINGSLTITGSVYGNVSASTIAAQTASIDLSVANYFTLTLSGSTRINVTNPRPGTTATLVINTDTGASASFSSNVKQPSGSFYAASPSGNIDIISFTAVDTNTVYAFPAQSFV